MRYFVAALLLIANCVAASAQGCGPQNPNCIVPTAPAGTNNNQAASTAFVQQAIGGGAPFWPVVNPSSGNFQGSGNPTAHQLMWSDANPQFNADVMQFFSVDPSASSIITFGGSATSGDAIAITFTTASGNCSAGCTVTYTVQAGDVATYPANVIAGMIAAIKANANLFNAVSATNLFGGGYANGAQIGYAQSSGAAGLAIDYNATNNMTASYTVSGSATETLTFPAGFFSSSPLYVGGAGGGSANAQTATATGFTLAVGKTLTYTPGATNTGSATLAVNGLAATTIQKFTNTGFVNLSGGEIVGATKYTLVYDGTVFRLSQTSVPVAGGSSTSTTYQLPNSLDNNPVMNYGRNPGLTPPAGSVLLDLAPTGPNSFSPTSRASTLGTLALYTANTSGESLDTAWYINNSSGSGWWFRKGLYANGGCTYNFQINCGLFDEGNGTVNSFGYYLNNNGLSITESGNIAGNPVLYTSSGTSTPHTFTTLAGTAIINVGIANAVPGQWSAAGTVSGAQTYKPAATASGTITWPAGTVDFSGTGGTSQVVKQVSPGAVFTVGQLACADLSNAGTGCSTNPTPCTTTASSLQYDAAGAFGCVAGVTSDGTNLTFSPSANTTPITITGGSITGSGTTSPGISMTGTLNTSGTVVGAVLNAAITDTSANAASTLINLKGGAAGTTQLFEVDINGNISTSAAGAIGYNVGSGAGAVTFGVYDGFGGNPRTGWTINSSDQIATKSNTATVMDYGATHAGAWTIANNVYMTGLTSGSGSAALCLNSNQVETDTSATICGISAMRFKNLLPPEYAITPAAALAGVMGLRTQPYRYKPEYQDHGGAVHVSLMADDVEAMDARCGVHDHDGSLLNYSDRCVETYLVGAIKELQAEIRQLRHQQQEHR